METGDIILLTRRKFDWKIHRWVLSWAIHILTGKYVHSALIYRRGGILFVREMEAVGVVHVPLNTYMKTYKNRGTIVREKNRLTVDEKAQMRDLCLREKAKYDYFNLLLWQPLKAVFGVFLGGNTKYRRACSEDTARIYNKVRENTFKDEKGITPMEVYEQFDGLIVCQF
jgi:hypothetical protein